MAEYPPTLQGVTLATLSVSELSAFRTNDSEIGPATNRLLSLDVPTFFDVTWLYFPFDFQVFENWFKFELNKGVNAFTIDLPVSAGILEHNCNFIGSYTATQVGRLVTVTATLRAVEKITNTEAQFDDLLLLAALVEDKNKLPVLNGLIQFANITLPDVFDTIKYGTDHS